MIPLIYTDDMHNYALNSHNMYIIAHLLHVEHLIKEHKVAPNVNSFV